MYVGVDGVGVSVVVADDSVVGDGTSVVVVLLGVVTVVVCDVSGWLGVVVVVGLVLL
jgi:hypothetical protein